MQYKSFLIENNISSLKESLVLFYGENLGLKNDIKNKIKFLNREDKHEIINLMQDEILINNNILFNEISNISLFEKKKIFLIDQVTDKILNIIEDLKMNLNGHKIYLFSDMLDKKSKLRNLFEKSEKLAVIPCYQDNEITIKKIIQSELKNYKGLTGINVNLILDNSGLDRIKLNNELNKIKIFFLDKQIQTEKLEILLNNKVNDDFNQLKDEALQGNFKKTNKLLAQTDLEDSKILFYLNTINVRLDKLYEVVTNKADIETSINKIKPPIFWKDKPNFIAQTSKWTSRKIEKMINKIYNLEIQLKSISSINKKILIKKLLVDICRVANS